MGAVYLSQQEQDPRQEASVAETPPGTVAVVHGEVITKEYLQRKAREQYVPEAITKEVLAIMLENEIEKRLLERQARDEGLNISDSATIEHTRLLYPDEELTPAMLEQGRQVLLKEDVSKNMSKTREAYTIGFWLPPEGYQEPVTEEQRRAVSAQRQVVPQFVTEVKKRLETNEDPLSIAKDMLRKYPVLEPILAVNGYLLSTTTNEGLLTVPAVYTYKDTTAQTPFFSVLFSMQPGQVREVTSSTSDGGLVIKVLSATDGPFDNYQEWLQTQKQQYVRLITPL